LDDRNEYSAGWKFNEWELKGVPIRIEIGPRDMANEQVIMVRRDTGEKLNVGFKDVARTSKKLMTEIHKNLFSKAKQMMEETIVMPDDFDEVVSALNNNKIVYIPYCMECEDIIKDKTGGAKALNYPLNQPVLKNKKCLQCGKDAKVMCYFGKSY